MKKKVFARAAFALFSAGMFSAGAFAADSVSIPLSGELPKSCEVTAFLDGPFNALNMKSTALQGAESLSPICNYGGTLSVKFESANGGTMNNTSVASAKVGYKLTVSGGLVNDAALTSPVTVSNWPAVANAVQTRSMSIKLDSPATVAGTYTDTILASVTPN